MGQVLTDAQPIQMMARELQRTHPIGQVADLQLVGQGEERTGHLLVRGEAVGLAMGQHVPDDDVCLRRRRTAHPDQPAERHLGLHAVPGLRARSDRRWGGDGADDVFYCRADGGRAGEGQRWQQHPVLHLHRPPGQRGGHEQHGRRRRQRLAGPLRPVRRLPHLARLEREPAHQRPRLHRARPRQHRRVPDGERGADLHECAVLSAGGGAVYLGGYDCTRTGEPSKL